MIKNYSCADKLFSCFCSILFKSPNVAMCYTAENVLSPGIQAIFVWLESASIGA